MSVKVKTVPKRIATVRIGSIIGIVIWKALASGPAPSMSAASWTSAGIEVSPARRITVEKGSSRHTCTVMMATIPSVGAPEPVVPLARSEPAHHLERPVDHTERRVENPQPAQRRQRDGSRPRHQDEEAHEELAAEVLEEGPREEIAQDHDQHLRDDGEDERVPERSEEHRVRDDVLEVLQPHEGEVQAPRRGIGQAEEQREQEGQGDEQEDVGERRREEQLPQPAIARRERIRGLEGGRGGGGFGGIHDPVKNAGRQGAQPDSDACPPAGRDAVLGSGGYLSFGPPATMFFLRHLPKISLMRVLASAMASLGESAPVAALANMSVIT